MKVLKTFSRFVLSGLLWGVCPTSAFSQSADTLFVYLSATRLDAYPSEFIQTKEQTSKRLTITTIDGEQHVYRLAQIDSVSYCAPDSLPRFESYKFNNKFNDQVFTDVEGEILDHQVNLSVGAIGKWLTPSFKLTDSLACAYIDSVRQYSKVSRLRFENPVRYTVARPGWQVLSLRKAEDDASGSEPVQVEDPKETVTKVDLNGDMLSTNAPNNYDDEGLENLLDGDLYTMFHSTWGTGAYEKLPLDEYPYIDIDLPEPLHRLQFSYTNRAANGRYPTALQLCASNDAKSWKVVRDFELEKDGLPTDALGTYQSPTIDLGGDYNYLRLIQTGCAYKNYLAWAEFSLYKVTEETPEEPEPEPEPSPEPDNQLKWVPFGTEYIVSVFWPGDLAAMIPTVNIDIEGGAMVSSKDYYLNAVISIDGAGIFPDFSETDVLIKGRGNSSWSNNAYAKNPYRLKFDTKQKPFGMTKGKSWVLQSNAQSGSMMANAIAMKAANLLGTAAPNHVIPVELYMNGNYRGSYIFNEKIGFANNSIELADESAATLLELDSYFDETYKFRSTSYNLPVNIKEPDFTDATSGTQLTMDDISTDFNAMAKAVLNGQQITDWVDVDYLVSFLSLNELVANYEVMHPKSTYLYKENLFGDSKYIFGPVWDMDWAFGYEGSRQYYTSGMTDNFYISPSYTFGASAASFWRNLRTQSEDVDRAYYKLWTRFINQGGLDELLDFCDDYYAFASLSFVHNASMWGDGRNYATQTVNAKKWLQRRALTIYGRLTPYDLDEEESSDNIWKASEASADDGTDDDDTTDVMNPAAMKPKTLFTVYDLRGILLKRNAAFNTWREGLAPGIYIVNGKKVLVQ